MESIASLKPSRWLELIKLPVTVRAEWIREIDSTFQGNTLYWRSDVKHVPLFVRRLINKQPNDATTTGIRVAAFRDIRDCLVLPDESFITTPDQSGEDMTVTLLKALHFYNSCQIFPQLSSQVSPDKLLRVCICMIQNLKPICSKVIQNVLLRNDPSEGLKFYYPVKWILFYMRGAIAGGLLSTIFGMKENAGDLDIFLPMAVKVNEISCLTRQMYNNWFSKLIRCAMLKFVTRTFDIEVGRIINVKALYKLSLLAVLKTIPLPARWEMFKLLEHLMSFVYNDKRSTEPLGSCVSDNSHRPFNLITQMTIGLSDIDLVIVPFVQHPLLSEIPLNKVFMYSTIAGFDFPHSKFITDDLHCAVQDDLTFYWNIEQSAVYSLCAPKRAYCRLIISCLHELSSVPSLLLIDTPVKRFLARYEKYYAPRVIQMTTRFVPSLIMLASSAFLDYGDFSVTGFRQKF